MSFTMITMERMASIMRRSLLFIRVLSAETPNSWTAPLVKRAAETIPLTIT